ncbi:DUF4062 domain-containing protein [Pseudobdellovibrio sp. HCB154]|uniref:DUF4062 domain-containing protein n=1 Tax=Pseudobdellovibrio sp. HCB154 TaxID=3386277 RepID=UPI0039171B18
MKKPTFFISSTIYDFADLRSALKYYLESLGCEVLASEYNDFKKSLDSHSYQECLNSISKADYYVLLIGSRVGGWFDEKNRISITRKEFQEAYKLHQKGQLKIINFVRAEVWDLRSDRAELAKHLELLDLTDKEAISSIQNYPSRFARDPEFIIDFLNEVGKNEQTKGAVKGENEFPSANWIHKFNSFRDIVDVINPMIFNGEAIDVAVTKKLLLKEVRHVLATSLVKYKEKQVFAPLYSIQRFYDEHRLDKSNRFEEFFAISAKRFDTLSSLSYQLLQIKYNPLILPRALQSSTFLKLDNTKGILLETPLYNALLNLQREIQLFSERNVAKDLSIITEYSPKRRQIHASIVSVKTLELVMFLYAIQRWSNIIELSKAIIKHLQGEDFKEPTLFGRSPVVGMNEEFEEETVTEDDIDDFLAKH